jgi:hypothetical protein
MKRSRCFDTAYFINVIIDESVTNMKTTVKFPDKKWRRLHPDNAQPHSSDDSVDHMDEHKFVRLSILHTHRIWLRVTSSFWNSKGNVCEMA